MANEARELKFTHLHIFGKPFEIGHLFVSYADLRNFHDFGSRYAGIIPNFTCVRIQKVCRCGVRRTAYAMARSLSESAPIRDFVGQRPWSPRTQISDLSPSTRMLPRLRVGSPQVRP